MKKILPLFLGLFIIAAILFNFRNTLSQPATIEKSVDEIGEIHRDNWREALLEFGDEDDTLDSLDYVPDFLR
jgi:hypothetical protein